VNRNRLTPWLIVGAVLAVTLLFPIVVYEGALLLTGSHRAASGAMRGALDAFSHAVQTWVVFELFVMYKMRNLRKSLQEK
jgi:hypothetical protein